ncbi:MULTISPECIES: hypothetical protein [unclassified Gordonia (in: high G+C Gram-positive bacteria)]|uniref:hypothetical protein n=1 Tax=unclassified Gordonia (in: high G+C Gram-positive bacteria) TaxID=2657482 RepID=UPI001FFF6191|nr:MULTISPECIES: hypothetical protein [unclassified Gordonia (in: high G+C Gram-positive bacteria)]UQE76408.1 hypothetical protein MYK68_07510 [Gordonia sp. PP30]
MKTGFDQPDGETPIEQLTRLAALRRDLAREEEAAVRRARIAGLSWAEIGLLLGASKQAMHKKYRKVG